MTDPKPCPAIAMIAVQEVQQRHQQELAAVVKLAAEASGIPDGEGWGLDTAKGQWVKRERKTDALNHVEIVE